MDDRKAETHSYDRWGVPRAFVPYLEAHGGLTFTDPYSSELPLSLAPAVVKKAVAAAQKAEETLEAADGEAAELYAAYQAVPAQVQREVNDAVSRGEEPPSLSETVDARQSTLAGPLRNAIALRDALRVAAGKAVSTADRAREQHRYGWRDRVASHVGEELPKVRGQLQDAIGVLADALNTANILDELKRACVLVDAEWIEQRTPTLRISSAQTVKDYGRSTPEVYERDREFASRRRDNGSRQEIPVDLIAEASKRVGWLGSYDEGGVFPNSLFLPLSSHEPVERRWDDV